MKIAIHGRKFNVQVKPFVQQVFDELAACKVELQISESFKRTLQQADIQLLGDNIYKKSKEIFDADLVFSLGGDGTFLETLSHVGSRELPILGFNFGRLGFLAAISPANIKESIQKLINNRFSIDERTMVEVKSDVLIAKEGMNFALNEVAITKTDTSSMIVVHAYINDQYLNTYWADGLMVSTATGSTGYSLSCGGPLVMPHSANFIITPICPHNLFVRPMVVSDDSEISFRVESRSNNYMISMDARSEIIGDVDAEILVKKANFKAKLIKMEGEEFLNTLRSKLNWGIDARN